MNTKHLLSALVTGMVLFAIPPAHADIMFSNGNSGGIGEVNVLVNQGDMGTTILGSINGTSPTVSVSFSSISSPIQTFFAQGNGQSDIQAEPSPGNTLMTSIDMRAQAGTAWTDVILNMDAAGNPCGMGQVTCGTALVTATDDMGQSFTTTLNKGNNFVTAIAGLNSSNVQEFIDDIQITESAPDPTTGLFGWTDFKQPRVSGLCTVVDAATGSCTPIPVATPEPSALALLSAALLLSGYAFYRRT